MFESQAVIFQTVTGSNMDEPCAGNVFDKGIAGKQFTVSVAEGMLIFEMGELRRA